VDIQTGYIGFFDILGYENLLEKNEPEEIAVKIIPLINGVGKEVLSEMKKQFIGTGSIDSDAKELHEYVAGLINWMMFSDTILITIPIIDEDVELSETAKLRIFLKACRVLHYKMFVAGLPLRGAITYGKFFTRESYFAGRPIVDAYRMCNKLELSACVVSDEVVTRSKELDDKCSLKGYGKFTVGDMLEYLIPMKTGNKKGYILRHLMKTDKNFIRSEVIKSFMGHNKDIGVNLQEKIFNTEILYNYLKVKNDEMLRKRSKGKK
jgi:hypothetical protein